MWPADYAFVERNGRGVLVPISEVVGMPCERVPISVSQLCELIEVDPARFRGVEQDPCKREGEPRNSSRLWIVLEPKEEK